MDEQAASLIFDQQHLTVTFYSGDTGRTGYELFDRRDGSVVAIPDTDALYDHIHGQIVFWRDHTPGEDDVIAYFQRFIDGFGQRMRVQ